MDAMWTDWSGKHHILSHARKQAEARGLDGFPVVDVDAHHYEGRSWSEIAPFIELPSVRRMAMGRPEGKGSATGGVLPHAVGNQTNAQRLIRPAYTYLDPAVQVNPDQPAAVAHFVHAMDQMGIDYAVMFPTNMLGIAAHPDAEVEAAVCQGHASWMVERILACEKRIITMLPLPFRSPEASLELIERFGDKPGVVGFMVTGSGRREALHTRPYMKIYAALEERGLPLGFHSGHGWQHAPIEQFNRFLGAHALGFPLFNMIHLINVVVNGIPERFPRLKLIWIESGLMWIPFLMTRLDNEYMQRRADAPMLKRLPSEYMREFYYSTQPLEYAPRYRDLYQEVFELIDAEHQLLYASDYPHNDFDVPSRIYDQPFLSETARRRILGQNALDLFHLPVPDRYLAASQGAVGPS